MTLFNTLEYIFAHPLNRGRKMAAFRRFFWWQLRSRLSSGAIEFDWVNNAKILVSRGEEGVTGNIYCGLHEFPDMAFLLHALRADDLFVDIGANVGSYTVLASASIGARTVCFEPIPVTYQKLLSNIDINQMRSRVTAHNIALAEAPGRLVFSADQNCMNHVITHSENSSNSVTVKVSTLDKCLKEVPFLIKIDVEGYELPTLQGAASILASKDLSAVILELNGSGQRYGFDDAKIMQLMFEHDFETYEYHPFKRQLKKRVGKSEVSGNTLFLRNAEALQQRLDTSPEIKVIGVAL